MNDTLNIGIYKTEWTDCSEFYLGQTQDTDNKTSLWEFKCI